MASRLLTSRLAVLEAQEIIVRHRRSTLSTAKRGPGVPLPLAHAIDVFGDK